MALYPPASFNPRVIPASVVQPAAQGHPTSEQTARASQTSPVRLPTPGSCHMELTAWDRQPGAGLLGFWNQRGSQSLLSRVQEEN